MSEVPLYRREAVAELDAVSHAHLLRSCLTFDEVIENVVLRLRVGWPYDFHTRPVVSGAQHKTRRCPSVSHARLLRSFSVVFNI